MKRIALFTSAIVVGLWLTGCASQQNTVIAYPGTGILTLKPFTAPANATATEISKGVYRPNTAKVSIPAGATIIVLRNPPAYTLTTTTQPAK